MKLRSYEMDMTEGPIFGKMFRFAVPLVFSGILQLLFNATDIIVLGNSAGDGAIAAVGSTTTLIMLFVNFFIGFSSGANAIVARYCGAKQQDGVFRSVHTSAAIGLISGAILAVCGIVFSRPLLDLMGTNLDVIDQSVIYMRIYMGGMIFTMPYNFGAAVMRAAGDTKRPLYYLGAASALNLVLDLLFVNVFHRYVDGVAIATVTSQFLLLVLVVRALMKSGGNLHLEPRKIRLDRVMFRLILHIGVPAGLQSALFSLTNVLIQSSINTFGTIAVAGNTAALSIEGFVYMTLLAGYQTVMSFTGQNYGAGDLERAHKVMWTGMRMGMVTSVILSAILFFFGHLLLGIYSDGTEVIEMGMIRLGIVGTAYILDVVMETAISCMRGYGYTVVPLIVILLGTCVFRIAWLYTAFRAFRSLETIYMSYPISWALTGAACMICYYRFRKRLLSGEMNADI